MGLGCRVRVRVGVRVILERAHHVLDEFVRGGDIGEISGDMGEISGDIGEIWARTTSSMSLYEVEM